MIKKVDKATKLKLGAVVNNLKSIYIFYSWELFYVNYWESSMLSRIRVWQGFFLIYKNNFKNTI